MTKVYVWGRTEGKYSDIVSDGGMDPRNITHPADEPGWQGLTDDDVNEITQAVIAFKSDVVKFIRAAEAKLKGKNT